MIYQTYSLLTGRRRLLVNNPPLPLLPAKGEGVLVIPDAIWAEMQQQVLQGATTDVVQAYVTQQTGVAPANDRYIQVDANGVIVGVHLADPVGCPADVVPAGHVLYQSAKATIGWTFNPQTLLATAPQLNAADLAQLQQAKASVPGWTYAPDFEMVAPVAVSAIPQSV